MQAGRQPGFIYLLRPLYLPAAIAAACCLITYSDSGHKAGDDEKTSMKVVKLHPDNPQPRAIQQVVDALHKGAVIAYPTDSCYALGSHIGDKAAMDRISRIRGRDKSHNFTLVCSDLAEVATYARVDNRDYRMLKHATPGPYTFILQATREVPRRLQNQNRKTIGIRIPEHIVVRTLLKALGEPLMSCTLQLPGDTLPLTEPYDIEERLEHDLDILIDGGHCGLEPTTVVDLTGTMPEVWRRGKGDLAILGLD